jgi:hypothetical protein
MTTADNRKYFVDVFSDWVTGVRTLYDPSGLKEPYSYYGSIMEIVNHLSIKDSQIGDEAKKYPFCCLVDDFRESHNSDKEWYSLNPTIYIFSYTDEDYTPQQRYDNVIKPVLYVIMEHLLSVIEFSDSYSQANEKLDWTKQAYKGSVAGMAIPDTVDCLELKFNNLLIKNNC